MDLFPYAKRFYSVSCGNTFLLLLCLPLPHRSGDAIHKSLVYVWCYSGNCVDKPILLIHVGM